MTPERSSSNDRRLIEGIDRSSTRTWPSTERLDAQNWCLQASAGWTRRANSASAFGPIPDTASIVSLWERWYRNRSLPTIVRVSPITPTGIITELDRRRYSRQDGALVMGRALSPTAPPDPVIGTPGLADTPDEDWWDVFGADTDRPLPRERLEQLWGTSRHRTVYPVRRVGRRPVAVGMGVQDGTRLAIFNMRTLRDDRGHGHALALVTELMTWGSASGCTSAYLQVAADNRPARSLYHRAGFGTVYEYRYRVQPNQEPPR